MKKTLFILLLYIPFFVFSQKPQVFIGLKAPHSINADISVQHQENARFGANIAYYFPYFNKMYYYAGGIIPIEFVAHGLNQKGVSLGLNYDLLSYYKEGKWHHFQLEYQRLNSGEYIYDKGKKAGTTESYYAEFKEKYNNISLIYGIRKELGNKKRFEFCYEFGFTLRLIERHYSISGSYSNKKPSDKIENIIDAMPMGRLGFNVKVF